MGVGVVAILRRGVSLGVDVGVMRGVDVGVRRGGVTEIGTELWILL